MKFIAFLRAINVGGRNIRMEKLRRIFESAGLKNVETVIASGNVIFDFRPADARAIEKKVEAILKKSLGYPVVTFVRSLEQLQAIAIHKPFKKIPASATVFVVFAAEAPPKATQRTLLSAQTASDRFQFRGREIFWLCLTRFSDSKFSGSMLEKILGQPLTVRNFNTVARIATKYTTTVKKRE